MKCTLGTALFAMLCAFDVMHVLDYHITLVFAMSCDDVIVKGGHMLCVCIIRCQLGRSPDSNIGNHVTTTNICFTEG